MTALTLSLPRRPSLTTGGKAIITSSDGVNPDGTANWNLVDAHTNDRYHAYWTLAQYNASWATTRIVVLHIPPTTT